MNCKFIMYIYNIINFSPSAGSGLMTTTASVEMLPKKAGSSVERVMKNNSPSSRISSSTTGMK